LICAADIYPVEFLGANILDDKPFIVMPYLKNGNARDYLQEHPDGNRLQIVRTPMLQDESWLVITSHVQLHGISLGLVYLLSHRVVHGDLKAVSYLDMSSYTYIHFAANNILVAV
jgi:hypothetical protein